MSKLKNRAKSEAMPNQQSETAGLTAAKQSAV